MHRRTDHEGRNADAGTPDRGGTSPLWDRLTDQMAMIEDTRPSAFGQRHQGRLANLVAWHLNSPRNPSYANCCAARQIDLTGGDLLSRLPIVDKGMLRRWDYAGLPAEPDDVVCVETSGTTSSVVAIPHSADSIASGLGDSYLRALIAGGVPAGARHWTIGHRLYAGQHTGSYLSFEHLDRVLPGQVLITNTADDLTEQLQRATQWSPVCISSSPRFLCRLAQHIVDTGCLAPIPTTVFYGGAAMPPGGRELIERAFGPVRLVAFYPTTDAGPLGFSPADDGVYRACAETHIVEVLDPDGQHVPIGERGDVVVTVLANRAAPLIRYRVGDRVTYLGVEANRVLMADIQRVGDVLIGDTMLPVSDVMAWTSRLQARGYAVEAVQLVRRRTPGGADQPVIRLVMVATPSPELERAGLDLLLEQAQIGHGIKDGTIASPRIEWQRPEADSGAWKAKPFVDETLLEAASA